MGRRKSSTTAGAVVKKPRAQVRKNKNVGSSFEITMFKYFNEYMRKRDMRGICYRIPDNRSCNQIIDLNIDSPDLGFISAECKSIKNSSENNGLLYFSTISRINSNGLSQIVNQHEFLKMSGRYGLLIFQFRDMKKIFIVPHMFVYRKVINGDLYITTEEIIKNGFDFSDKKASLKLFIKNYCSTEE